MSAKAELKSAPKEPEAKRRQNTAPHAFQEPAQAQGPGVMSRAFSGAPGVPADNASRVLHNSSLAHPVNSSLRAAAIQRAQRTHGNHYVQRLVTGVRPPGPQAPGVMPPASTGQALDEGTRSFMEPRLGADLSGVKVHTDDKAAAAAAAMDAKAFTTGRDIYFAAGQYAPASTPGRRLLAHELTHTVQQGARGPAPSRTAPLRRYPGGLETQGPDGLQAKLTISQPHDPDEQEAERLARQIVPATASGPSPETRPAPPRGSSPCRKCEEEPQVQPQGKPVLTSPETLAIQRQPADQPPPAKDDPAVLAQLDDETKSWEGNADQDADLMLRARASRMVLLLKWRKRPTLRTQGDLDTFAGDCSKLSLTELDTLGAFDQGMAEFALGFYPKGFPLTWGGRVQAALTLNVNPLEILVEWKKSYAHLVEEASVLIPALSQHGLPVAFKEIARLDDFRLRIADARSEKDSAVRNYARESIHYIQMKWMYSFAFMWENIVKQVSESVSDGTIVADYTSWKDFVDHKQASLRELPARAREKLAQSEEDVQQLQTDALNMKDAALLVSMASALTTLLGILGAWNDASALFDKAHAGADQVIANSGGGDRFAKSLEWSWDNDYFGGAAAAWGENLIQHGPEIMGEIALIIVLQFIPGVDLAVDAYLAFTAARDVLSMLEELRESISAVMDAKNVADLQKAAARLAQILTNGAITILIVLATLGIGKAASKVRKRTGELRAADKTLTAEAAEKKALEEMSVAERKPLEEASQKVEAFDRRYSPETKPILDTPGVRGKLNAISQDARSLIELCESACLPPAHQLLDADLKLLEKIQQKLGRPGYDRGLKEYFYRRRSAPGGLKQAIEDLEEVKPKNLQKFLDADKARLKAEAVAERATAVKEAQKEIGKKGTFKDPDLEEAYQRYLKRKAAVKEKPRDRADWKVASDWWATESPTVRGNDFNRSAGQSYPYNEVHLENGKRLDSYRRNLKDPSKGEIVSRKAVDFDVLDEATFRRYLKEFEDKYASGTKIRSDKYPRLDGETIQGRKILEVPKTNQGLPEAKAFEKIAESEGIEIRYRTE